MGFDRSTEKRKFLVLTRAGKTTMSRGDFPDLKEKKIVSFRENPIFADGNPPKTAIKSRFVTELLPAFGRERVFFLYYRKLQRIENISNDMFLCFQAGKQKKTNPK